MHGILYLRKSREDEQYEKNTGEDVLQTHRERLVMLCKSREITFDERAEVRSGDTIAGRPKFQNILDTDLPSGQYSCIIVTEISRLGRGDMEDAGRIYKTIIHNEIKIVTPNKIYDPLNPSDLRQLRFELFMSREEYESIKERLWNNRNYRATQGYAGNYIVTLGFRQSRGIVEIIPEEEKLVLEIFTMRSENYSYQEIADYFNSRNLKTKRGTKYHESTIYKILKNPRYIGVAKWQGKEYIAKHPAIVSLDLWNSAQDINAERHHKRRGSKNDNPYLVELYCRECGQRMYGERSTPQRVIDGVRKLYKSRDIYICRGRKSIPKCWHHIGASVVHSTILDELGKIISDPQIFLELVNERESRLGVDTNGLSDQVDELNKQVKDKNILLVKIENDYEKGDLSALLYTKHVEKISKEIASIEGRIKKIKADLLKSAIKISPPMELQSILKTFLNNWNAYPNSDKKLIIRSFLPRVEVNKQGEFFIAITLPDSIEI
ncbi:putative resolvase YokA [Candidatus Desulfosporosinus infrequens]|uniref:Putative resolvase YokA n=1 Tax=Candidatus Desulfosporosinus infrequens TaxID=2043169 RepID=A0A2U3LH57_9FIRM|nr:putative resolvase YokA [Candidatus Desulfosporosinus infrequens]